MRLASRLARLSAATVTVLALSTTIFGCGSSGGGGSTFTSAPLLATVSIQQFAVTTPTVTVGQSVGFTYDVRNTGGATASVVVAQLYLSNQPITATNYAQATPIGTSVQIQAIDPGFDESGSTSVTVTSTNGVTTGAGFVALVVTSVSATPTLVSVNQSVNVQ